MKYLASLDGLRAVAVFLVLFAHAKFPFPHSGGIGVDIFFVLSGFLITSILSIEAERFGRISFKNFYIRRALRLFPCLLLTCAIFSIWSLIIQNVFPFKPVFIVLTYTANWAEALSNVDLSSLLPCWSLGIEGQYYLIWPIVICMLEKNVKSCQLKGIFLLFLFVLLVLYRFEMVGIYSATRIFYALDTHMDGLVLGSALSYFLKDLIHAGGLPALKGKVLSYFIVPGLIVGLVLMMMRITWKSPWMGKFGFFFAASAAAFMIIDMTASRYSLLRPVLSVKPLVFIGKISYGLYLLHKVLFSILDHYFPGVFGVQFALIKIAVSIIAASISYYCIEIKFLRFKNIFEKTQE